MEKKAAQQHFVDVQGSGNLVIVLGSWNLNTKWHLVSGPAKAAANTQASPASPSLPATRIPTLEVEACIP
eukprot:6455387-Amphidinium_carterae.1